MLKKLARLWDVVVANLWRTLGWLRLEARLVRSGEHALVVVWYKPGASAHARQVYRGILDQHLGDGWRKV